MVFPKSPFKNLHRPANHFSPARPPTTPMGLPILFEPTFCRHQIAPFFRKTRSVSGKGVGGSGGVLCADAGAGSVKTQEKYGGDLSGTPVSCGSEVHHPTPTGRVRFLHDIGCRLSRLHRGARIFHKIFTATGGIFLYNAPCRPHQSTPLSPPLRTSR